MLCYDVVARTLSFEAADIVFWFKLGLDVSVFVRGRPRLERRVTIAPSRRVNVRRTEDVVVTKGLRNQEKRMITDRHRREIGRIARAKLSRLRVVGSVIVFHFERRMEERERER